MKKVYIYLRIRFNVAHILKRKISISTLLAWIFFLSLMIFLMYFTLMVVRTDFTLGNHKDPLFWIWLAIWSIHGFFWYEQVKYLEKKSRIYTFIAMAVFFSLYAFSKLEIFPIITKYLHLIVVSPLIGLIRGLIVEVVLRKKNSMRQDSVTTNSLNTSNISRT